MSIDRTVVDAKLAAAGVDPSDDERAALVELYATVKPGVEALYALRGVRYESPALVFQAAPKLDDWGA